MKKSATILTFFLLACVGFCQVNNGGNSVLLIPFNPRMYNNQQCEDMNKKTGMTYDQILFALQQGLDSCIVSSCKDSLRIVSLINSYVQSASGDLELVHGASDYFMTTRPSALSNKKSKNMFSDFQTKKKATDPREKTITNGELNTQREDLSNKFMSVKFQDPGFVNSITTKYAVKYLAFITQFEILGDYSNPYKTGDRSYNNTVKIHYAIFKSDGTFLTGDYVTTEYPAREVIPSRICKMFLPEVAKAIGRKIR